MKYSEKNNTYYRLIEHYQCKRKTVLSQLNPNAPLAKLPTYLYQISKRERELKYRIFNSLNIDDSAIYLKSRKDYTIRQNDTLYEMQSRRKFIFNACLIDNGKIAKYDLLVRINVHDNDNNSDDFTYFACLISENIEPYRNNLIELYWNNEILNKYVKWENNFVLFSNNLNSYIKIDISIIKKLIDKLEIELATTENNVNQN